MIKETLSFSSEQVLGSFFPFGGFTYSKFDHSIYIKAIEYLHECTYSNDGKLIKANKLKATNKRPKISNSDVYEAFNAYLTTIHEDIHFYQIVGLPIGILLFRLILTRTASAQRFFIDKVKRGDNFTIPIIQWNDSQSYKDKDVTNTSLIWSTIKNWENILFGDKIVTIKEGIDTIKRVWGLLKVANDRYFTHSTPDFEIISNHPEESLAVPSKTLTTLRIIESYARQHEILILLSLNLPKQVEKKLFNERKNEFYWSASNYINKELKSSDPRTIMFVLDLALATPIDSSYNSFWKNPILWEDINPGYRAMKIINVLKGNSIHWDELDQNGFLALENYVCDSLEWARPSDFTKYSTKIKGSEKAIINRNEFMRESYKEIMSDNFEKVPMFEDYFLNTHKSIMQIRNHYPDQFSRTVDASFRTESVFSSLTMPNPLKVTSCSGG